MELANDQNEPIDDGQNQSNARPACEACRNMKMKCIRTNTIKETTSTPQPCDRCQRVNRVCKIPEPRPRGRRRGARGRYQGFEKAARKLCTEMRKANLESEVENIQALVSSPIQDQPENSPVVHESPHLRSPSPDSRAFESPTLKDHRGFMHEECLSVSRLHHFNEPISKPLALLADASDAARASEPNRLERGGGSGYIEPLERARIESTLENGKPGGRLLGERGYISLGLQMDQETLEQGLDHVFAPISNEPRYANYFHTKTEAFPRDVGSDVDPVDLGLVTMDEAQYLFSFYFTRLHLMHGILDPVLHTPEFVRSRSALLFTWILAIAAQFEHASASLAQRLRFHGEKLSKNVHASGFKSVEIVQGYYISLLSATPAETLAEERSWLYTMYAFGVAAELGLDQKSYPKSTRKRGAPARQSPESSNSTTQDHDMAYSQRCMRNRERTWLRIVLWERANSATHGRIHSFPETSLTRNVEKWWLHPLADSTDRYTSAFILLRQTLALLQNNIREQSQLPQMNLHWIRHLVDDTLRPWCEKWLPQLSDSQGGSAFDHLPNIFLRYVYLHGRLWTLSIALHDSATEGKNLAAIQRDCFEAAVSACEVAVRDLQAIGEPLYGMLAPTWAMISYAAILALNLFPTVHGYRAEDQVELFALLGQVSIQLERAGKTPSHRFGIAALLGQHLRRILQVHSRKLTEKFQPDASLVGSINERWESFSREETCQKQPEDSLPSEYSPFLTDTLYNPTDDDFAGLFREIFGTGFGNVF